MQATALLIKELYWFSPFHDLEFVINSFLRSNTLLIYNKIEMLERKLKLNTRTSLHRK